MQIFTMNPVTLLEKQLRRPSLLVGESMSRCHGGCQYLRETPGHGTRLIPVLRQPDGSRPQALPQQGVLLEKKNRLRQPFGIPGSAEIDISAVLQDFIL